MRKGPGLRRRRNAHWRLFSIWPGPVEAAEPDIERAHHRPRSDHTRQIMRLPGEPLILLNSRQTPAVPLKLRYVCDPKPRTCRNSRPRLGPDQSRACARSGKNNEEYRSFQHRGDRRARKREFSSRQGPKKGSRRSLSVATQGGRRGRRPRAMAFRMKGNELAGLNRTSGRPHLPGRPSVLAISMISSRAAVGSSLLHATPSPIFRSIPVTFFKTTSLPGSSPSTPVQSRRQGLTIRGRSARRCRHRYRRHCHSGHARRRLPRNSARYRTGSAA